MNLEVATTNNSGGHGLGGMVFIVFLSLKLAGVGVVATWSWWWVTAPLWIPFAALLGILSIIAIVKTVNRIDRRIRQSRQDLQHIEQRIKKDHALAMRLREIADSQPNELPWPQPGVNPYVSTREDDIAADLTLQQALAMTERDKRRVSYFGHSQ